LTSISKQCKIIRSIGIFIFKNCKSSGVHPVPKNFKVRNVTDNSFETKCKKKIPSTLC